MKGLILLFLGMGLTQAAHAGTTRIPLQISSNDYSCVEGEHTGSWPAATMLKIDLRKSSLEYGFNSQEAVHVAARGVTCQELENALPRAEEGLSVQADISYSTKFVKMANRGCLKVDREDVALLVGGFRFAGAGSFNTPVESSSCR